MCELIVHGSGFLWHQIRCIIAILILIGEKKEEIDLVKSLLDIDKYPCTPNYQLASGEMSSYMRNKKWKLVSLNLELPLVLFDCQFNDIQWIYDQDALRATICHLQRHWASFQIRSTMIKTMLNNLENQILNQEQLPILSQLSIINNDSGSILGHCSNDNSRRTYQPVLTRPVRDSVNTKIEKYQNRQTKLLPTKNMNKTDQT